MSPDLGPFGVEANIDEIIAFFEALEAVLELATPLEEIEPSAEQLDDSLDLSAR